MPNIPEEKPSGAESIQTERAKQNSLYMKTFSFAVEFGFITTLPLVAFAYLGKFLDGHYHTNNKIFLYAGILLALLTTCLLFLRRIRDIMKDMQK